ncbi:hypothetical protein [Agaribacter flavus]|uniref:Transmembrane protein n=1 Tax=Agaribacter flavus TaxID=1902781 RepID=A0ABV7FMK7_9ALTE
MNFAKFTLTRDSLKTRLAEYNFSQLCYFTGFLLLIIALVGGMGTFYLALFISILGLARELNLLFLKLWNYAIGKSITVIVYAGAANIALAYAASEINQVTGIEPYPFIFTIGFTALVFTPFWIALSSLLILSLVLLAINFWLVLSIVLKLFRIRVKAHWEDKKNVWMTMIMRLILVPFVCFYLLSIAFPYFVDSSFEKLISTKVSQTFDSNPFAQNEGDSFVTASIDLEPDNQDKTSIFADETIKKSRTLRSIIADFVFFFEAYEYSACKKDKEQRSVIIDDFSVLLISINTDMPYGYEYEVVKCIPVYEGE